MIKGLTLDEAAEVTNEDIAEYLGGLPKEKMHCSVMGRDALEKAIAHYRGEEARSADGNIVCECFGVTDREIERAVRENHLQTIEDVTSYVKAGGGCGNCHDRIQEIIDAILGNEPPAKSFAWAGLTPLPVTAMPQDRWNRRRSEPPGMCSARISINCRFRPGT